MFSRPTLIAAIGFSAAAIAAVLAVGVDREESLAMAPPVLASADAADQASIEVLRVGARGDTMIAGRGPARSDLGVVDNGRDIGHAVIDDHGDWVFVPALPLSPGSHLLAISASETPSPRTQTAVVVVSEPDTGPCLVVVIQPDGTSRVLQGADAGDPSLALVVADRDPGGRLTLTGRAGPDAVVQLYLDNRFVGRSRGDADGGWRMAARAPHHGTHALRVDRIGSRGKVGLRMEYGWDAGDDMTPARTDLDVRPTAASWRIARRLESGATAYTVVYRGGRDQQRDPDMVYPGQVFTAPEP